MRVMPGPLSSRRGVSGVQEGQHPAPGVAHAAVAVRGAGGGGAAGRGEVRGRWRMGRSAACVMVFRSCGTWCGGWQVMRGTVSSTACVLNLPLTHLIDQVHLGQKSFPLPPPCYPKPSLTPSAPRSPGCSPQGCLPGGAVRPRLPHRLAVGLGGGVAAELGGVHPGGGVQHHPLGWCRAHAVTVHHRGMGGAAASWVRRLEHQN